MAELSVVVSTLGGTLRPAMLAAGFDKASCVAATRIALDVLAAVGIPAKPIPVILHVSNAEYMAMANDPVRQQEVADLGRAGLLTKDSVGGPWQVYVAKPGDPNPGAGHVVVGLLQEGGFLLDVTADQTNRPHKNIHVTEVVLVHPVAADFFTVPGTQIGGWGNNGTTMVYTRVANRRYTTSPNWKRRSDGVGLNAAFKRVTAETLQAVRAVL